MHWHSLDHFCFFWSSLSHRVFPLLNLSTCHSDLVTLVHTTGCSRLLCSVWPNFRQPINARNALNFVFDCYLLIAGSPCSSLRLTAVSFVHVIFQISQDFGSPGVVFVCSCHLIDVFYCFEICWACMPFCLCMTGRPGLWHAYRINQSALV